MIKKPLISLFLLTAFQTAPLPAWENSDSYIEYPFHGTVISRTLRHKLRRGINKQMAIDIALLHHPTIPLFIEFVKDPYLPQINSSAELSVKDFLIQKVSSLYPFEDSKQEAMALNLIERWLECAKKTSISFDRHILAVEKLNNCKKILTLAEDLNRHIIDQNQLGFLNQSLTNVAKVTLAHWQLETEALEKEVAVSLHTLRRNLGLPHDCEINFASPFTLPEVPQLNLDGLVSQAFESRPSLQILTKKIQAFTQKNNLSPEELNKLSHYQTQLKNIMVNLKYDLSSSIDYLSSSIERAERYEDELIPAQQKVLNLAIKEYQQKFQPKQNLMPALWSLLYESKNNKLNAIYLVKKTLAEVEYCLGSSLTQVYEEGETGERMDGDSEDFG